MQPDDLYRRWIEQLWAGQAHVARELVRDEFVGHWPDHDVRGPAALAELVAQTHATLKPLRFFIEISPFSSGAFVAGRWRGEGVQGGKPVRFAGNDILRVDGGKFAEYWTASVTLP